MFVMGINLTDLNNIEGVGDSFIFSTGGELLAPQLSYKDARIEHFGREVAMCSALLEQIKQEADFFELVYEDWHIIVRISHNFFIIVVCEDTADTTLIKLTLNVLNEEIKGDKDVQKSLRKSLGKRDLLVEAQKESELQELFARMKITS